MPCAYSICIPCLLAYSYYSIHDSSQLPFNESIIADGGPPSRIQIHSSTTPFFHSLGQLNSNHSDSNSNSISSSIESIENTPLEIAQITFQRSTTAIDLAN